MKTCTLMLILLLCAPSTFAQAPTVPTTPLTYEQALALLAEVNARLDAQKLQIQAVDDRVKKHDEDPTVVRKFITSPLGVALMTAAGTYLTTHKFAK